MAKHAIIYDRASTHGQANNWSRDDAARVGAELAEKHGYTHELRAEVKSGEELKNRPVMLALLDDVDAGRVQAIIVQDLSRLSRDQDGIDGRVIRQICRDAGCLVITQEKVYDFARDVDDDLADIQFLVAKWQKRANIKAMVRGMKEKARQGGYMGGLPPLGYELVYTPGKDGGRPTSELTICKPEAELVRLAFRLYVEHGGIGTARELNALGHRKPVKGRKRQAALQAQERYFCHTDILRIIRNPLYAGYMRWGGARRDSRYTRDFEPTRVHRLELQIVPVELWEQAQQILGRRAKGAMAQGEWIKHPFSGLMCCAGCGGPLYGATQYHVWQGKRHDYVVYSCDRGHRYGKDACSSRQYMTEGVVASAVLPLVVDLLQQLDVDQALEEAARGMNGSGPESARMQIQAELGQTSEAKQRVVAAIAAGTITEAEASATLGDLRRTEERLQRKMAKLAQRDRIRADVANALEVLRNQDIEITLETMRQGQRGLLHKFLRLIFARGSLLIQAEGNCRRKWGVLLSYRLTEEFEALMGEGLDTRYNGLFEPRSLFVQELAGLLTPV